MYPRDFFDTYWRTEIRNEIFVAMPFHQEFTPIWELAIRPAIELVSAIQLRARRVDVSTLTGSVLISILDGIAHSRLILADISVAREGKWQGQRNGNVMYEIGLAHAIRQSTEILLIRSDDEPLNFDVGHIIVHRYDRDQLDNERANISRLISDLLKQIEQEKSLKVQRAIDFLDSYMLKYLSKFATSGPLAGPDPSTRTISAISTQAALSRLQQLGIIRSTPLPDGQTAALTLTSFGSAVVKALGL